MKERQAILINSSDVRGQADLPGARIDIENWVSFLSSPVGGSWLQQEVQVLHKPSPQAVAALLQNNRNVYCFVAFSGHGSEGHVVLSDHAQRCPLSTLMPQGARGTLIADSCRSLEQSTNFSTGHGKSGALLAEQAPVTKSASAGRSMNFRSLTDSKQAPFEEILSSVRFRKAIKESATGILTMQSCGEDEEADEDPASGGLYTSALLDAAVKFRTSTMKRGILTTRQAHIYADGLMPVQQNPEYSPQDLAFPFAVKVTPISII